MIEEYVPPDHPNDSFYEGSMEQQAHDLNNSSATDEHDSLPFPIAPLQSTSSKDQRKRLDTLNSESGIDCPLALFRSIAPSPAAPIETSTPHPSISQHAQVARSSPK